MPNSYFSFKKFTVWQDKCAMKVGTDGVLLGAWVSTEKVNAILDIGTGTGLIALMLAQKCNAQIDAIDIDPDAFVQAKENVSASSYADRIQVYHQSLEEFIPVTDKKYDLIISNPPYFKQSLKSPNNKRTIARHTTTLSFTDIIETGKSLLTSNGRIALIIPFEQAKELHEITLKQHLRITKQTDIYPTPSSTPKRLLAEISSNLSAACKHDSLIIEESRHVYTEAFNLLTKDFYLNH